MAELDLGRIRFFDKGEHSMETEYVLWDFVEGDGSTYLYTNKTGSTGKALTNGAYWKKLASGLTEAEINAVLIATQEANTATTQANDARDRAIATTDETVIAKNATIQATGNANTQAGRANEAAKAAILATEAANSAAGLADTARLAIQDDLALKANHGYDSSPKTLKEVEDDTINTTEKPTAQSLSELNARITALEAILSNKIKDRIDVTKEFNVWGKTNLILYGDGASSKTPDFIGQKYIDTTNGNVYIAVGTSNAGNWKLV